MLKMTSAIVATIVVLCLCGFVFALLIYNYTYVEPELQVAVFTPELPAAPSLPAEQKPPFPGETVTEPELPSMPPGGTGSNLFPLPPTGLLAVDDLIAPNAVLYLFNLSTLTLSRAVEVSELTPVELLEQLRHPSEEQLALGYNSPLPAEVELRCLGREEGTLYVLLTYNNAALLSALGEAVMCDAVVLSLTSMPEIAHVQFVVDLSLGYQGRLDIAAPFDQDHLCLFKQE